MEEALSNDFPRVSALLRAIDRGACLACKADLSASISSASHVRQAKCRKREPYHLSLFTFHFLFLASPLLQGWLDQLAEDVDDHLVRLLNTSGRMV
jgi:hypothetical protein